MTQTLNTPLAAHRAAPHSRAWGRTELAQRYCPTLSASAAWRKLKDWIALAPGLNQRLADLGYRPDRRTFTPLQVRAIIEALGEP